MLRTCLNSVQKELSRSLTLSSYDPLFLAYIGRTMRKESHSKRWNLLAGIQALQTRLHALRASLSWCKKSMNLSNNSGGNRGPFIC